MVFLDLGFQVYDEAPLRFLKGGVLVIQPFLINPFPTSPDGSYVFIYEVICVTTLCHTSMGMALYKKFMHHMHGMSICLGPRAIYV